MIVDSTQHGHKINMTLFGEAIVGRSVYLSGVVNYALKK